MSLLLNTVITLTGIMTVMTESLTVSVLKEEGFSLI